VRTRTLWTTVLVLGGIWVTGCQQSVDHGSEREAAGRSRVQIATIPNVTIDALQAQLGADFTVKNEGSPLELSRHDGNCEVVFIVAHDTEGKVQNVTARVLGPKDSSDQIEELWHSTIETAGMAVGLTKGPELRAYADIALIYAQANFAYAFNLKQIYFSLLPSAPVETTTGEGTLGENFVQRDVCIVPVPRTGAFKRPSIRGASLKQLHSLLADFTVSVELPGQVIVYEQTQPTHTDYVVCTLNDADKIAFIEAFAGQVTDQTDADKLGEALWVKLAGLEYEDCDEGTTVAFITGPRMAEDRSDVRAIGAATYLISEEPMGRPHRLGIFASEP